MPSLDSILILINAEKKYSDYLTRKIVDTENWNKVADERDARDEGHPISEFYLAMDQETNKAVGCLSLVMDKSVDNDPKENLFSIGNFYILPEYRGLRIGEKMFNLVMERTKGVNTVLQAVDGMIEFYERKYAFVHSTPYYFNQARLDCSKITLKSQLVDSSDYRILNLSEIDWSLVEAYDLKQSGRLRSGYVKGWMTHSDATSTVALDNEDKLVGFACIRPQIANRLAIGPFYSDNPEIAKLLLYSLLNRNDLTAFDQIWIRYPEVNKEALRLIESIHEGEFEIRKGTKIMFTQKLITTDTQKIFSILEANHAIC